MNPHIPHHNNDYSSNVSALLNYIWEWSIHYGSLSVILTLLHSSMNQELFEKHLCNKRGHYEKYEQFLVSQSVRKFCYLKIPRQLLKAFWVDLKACLGLVLPNQYCPIVVWENWGWFSGDLTSWATPTSSSSLLWTMITINNGASIVENLLN